MSTTTISQYQQISLSDLDTLSPDTGARVAVSTLDQTYRVFISDGTRWNEMSSTRTTGIPYTLLDYTGAASEQLTCTPACHFDASPPSANISIEYSTSNKMSKWKSLTGGHELTQHVLTDQPSHQNSNDVNGKFGVHMNTPGSGMHTDDDPLIMGAEVTIVVYKPIGSGSDQTDVYRDVNVQHAKPPAGNHKVKPWGSNNVLQTSLGGGYNNVELYHAQSNSHHYQYTGRVLSTYNTFPGGGLPDTDIGGIGKVAGYNQNFIDSRQLSVIINTPRPVTVSQSNRYPMNTRTIWNTYWTVEGNAQNNRPKPWVYSHYNQMTDSQYTGFCVGTRSDETFNPYCMVNEVMVFDKSPELSELNNICDHLVNKWNIPNWNGLGKTALTVDPSTF